MGETYIDGSQYHWMEPYAINTTNNAIIAWRSDDMPPELHRLALNPHGRAGTRSGRTGPPRGTVISGIARRLSSRSKEDSLDITDLLVHIGDISYATGYESEWDRWV